MRAVMVTPCTTYCWSLLILVKSDALDTMPMYTLGSGQFTSPL